MELAIPTDQINGSSAPILNRDLINNELIKEPNHRALLLSVDHHFKVKSKLTTPTDELTGMPLPVLPPKGIPKPQDTNKYNWHHHYHPSTDSYLSSAAGLAVRHARLQLLPIKSHHNTYHAIFEGPPLPTTGEGRFGQVILASAGYIPPMAIDVTKDDPSEPVTLSKFMRHRLQHSGEIEVRGKCNISNFIKDYLVAQDFTNVKDEIIEEFLETKSFNRKRFLGHWLLAIASEVAIEPIMPVYHHALSEGLLVDSQVKLPNIVKYHINGRKTSEKAIKALHKRFKKESKSVVLFAS